uniref:TOG domain-containing protein n=1 Tax=Macrostomum lignano TaxID=282301 RepID=A0A1I8ICP4_9PLAT
MSVDAESIESLMQAITGLSFSEEEISKNYEKIPPYLRLYEVETAEKLRVVRTLPVVASNLGPSKVKDVLIPKIDELITAAINNGEDELLLEVCRQLGTFPHLMGSANNIVNLVPPLGRVLSSVEEVVVGEAAADALIKVVAELSSTLIETNCVPLIKTVFDDDLYCSSRRAGCRLIVPCYAKISSNDIRSELKSRLINAANQEEEILLVREAAVTQLGLLAQSASKDRAEILASLVTLSNDNHRDIRAASVRSLLDLVKLYGEKELESTVYPVLERYAEDSHRNTRQNFAAHIAEFQTVFNKIGKQLGPLFIRLWEDNEPEVRRASAKNLVAFADACSKDTLNSQLVPKLKEHLVNEHDDRVRREIIAETARLLTKIRKEDSTELVKTVVSLITESGSAGAKQAVFDHLKDILAVTPPADLKNTIIPSLMKLYSDQNWRVRLGVVKNLPELMSAVDEAQISGTLVPAYISWLKDSASEIRDSAAQALGRVVKDHKSLTDGIAKSASLAALATEGNYQFRKVWITCAVELMDKGAASCIPVLVPQLMKLSSDKVPNVRLAVVKALVRLATHFDANIIKKDIISPLVELSKDEDADVRFYAEEAVSKQIYNKHVKDAKPVPRSAAGGGGDAKSSSASSFGAASAASGSQKSSTSGSAAKPASPADKKAAATAGAGKSGGKDLKK